MLEAQEAGIGMIVQEAGTIAGISVAENIFLGNYKRFKIGPIIDRRAMVFEARKALFESAAAFLNAKYGAGTVEVALRDSYYNMREKIEPHMAIVEAAQQAMRDAGVTPRVVPIRGGTDGARLSYEGLPCPNLFTGGENYHGRFEYVPVEDMEAAVRTLKCILRNAAK